MSNKWVYNNPKIPKNKEFYEKNYVQLNKTSRQIANEIGCNQTTVSKLIKKFNLSRNASECKKGRFYNEKHHSWKGDNVGYVALHKWIKRRKKKTLMCEKCGKITTKLDLANISGGYKRDISDFRWLCRRCHNNDHPNWCTGKKKEEKNGLFKCPKCGEFKNKKEFYKSKITFNKISSYCIKCNSKYKKNYLNRKKI